MLILVAAIVGILLVGNEVWWRRHTMHDEFSRKFIHITVGSFVAFWPFLLSWPEIELLSIAFLVVVSLSKYLHVFQAIHSVQRPTWGELFFAAAVGAIALVTHDKYIYTAALLQMSLADGFAAVVGTHVKRGHYTVLGHTKSLAGSAAFFIVSLSILIGYAHYSSTASLTFVPIAMAATLIENVGVLGLDNLLVPLLVAGALTLIR